jgi:hypothetical protein
VINITDGLANDGNPLKPAEQLRGLSSSDGNVLLFNLHISEKAGASIEFPDNEANLPDKYARLLFRMSSPLPRPMWDEARAAHVNVTPTTRGFAFNAELAAVVRFLNIGTQINPLNFK